MKTPSKLLVAGLAATLFVLAQAPAFAAPADAFDVAINPQPLPPVDRSYEEFGAFDISLNAQPSPADVIDPRLAEGVALQRG